MPYQFERFTGFNKRTGEPTVSITRAKAIGLSSTFCDENDVDQYKYAVLYYDRLRNSIGFRLTNDEKEQSRFSITRTHKSKGKNSAITAIAFFSNHQISTDKYAHKYIPKKVKLKNVGVNELGHMFIFDLKEEQPEIK